MDIRNRAPHAKTRSSGGTATLVTRGFKKVIRGFSVFVCGGSVGVVVKIEAGLVSKGISPLRFMFFKIVVLLPPYIFWGGHGPQNRPGGRGCKGGNGCTRYV